MSTTTDTPAVDHGETTETAHSPLPWRVTARQVNDAEGGHVATVSGNETFGFQDDANAELIVQCVNAHDALVAALEAVQMPNEHICPICQDYRLTGPAPGQHKSWCPMAKVDAALALVKKGGAA